MRQQNLYTPTIDNFLDYSRQMFIIYDKYIGHSIVYSVGWCNIYTVYIYLLPIISIMNAITDSNYAFKNGNLFIEFSQYLPFDDYDLHLS